MDAPRRAGVSSFGIGGTNAHVVLEEAPEVAATSSERDHQLLVISAKTERALDVATSRLADHLASQPAVALADVAWTLQAGRGEFAHRRAITAASFEEATALLRDPRTAGVATSIHSGGPRPVAFLFSGQGSQYPGMSHELYVKEPAYREAIERCAALLDRGFGLDLRRLLFTETGEEINETQYAQPVLFAVEYALACLWRSWGVVPKAMLGHSIGEYVAAHLSGVLNLDDALSLVVSRGRLMQACLPGAMAAVHLPAAELLAVIPSSIEIAAINGPSLCAVAGPRDALQALLTELKGRGVQSVPLKTSHAFHSAMMEPAQTAFAEVVASFSLSAPTISFISNVTGGWITAEQAISPTYYSMQLRRPVQFSAGIQTLLSDPELLLLEVGPGTALSTMALLNTSGDRRNLIVPSMPHIGSHRSETAAVLQAAGRLWASGVTLDWRQLHGTVSPRRVPLPTYPLERNRYWVEKPLQGAPEQTILTADVANWTYAPTWIRDASSDSQKPSVSGTWIVVCDAGPLANAVVDKLRLAGAEAILAEIGSEFAALDETHYRVRLCDRGDIGELVQRIAKLGDVTGAIYICGPRSVRDLDLRTFLMPVVLAEHLQSVASGSRTSLIVATFGAQSVLDESIHDHQASLAIGPTLVLPTEMPGFAARAVDFVKPSSDEHITVTAQALVLEAASVDAERVVAWRGGRRWLRRYSRIAMPTADRSILPLKRHGVYLITGGLGGIGLTLANGLAMRTSARLILTGRTPLPPRDDWDRVLRELAPQSRVTKVITSIRAIEDCGAEIMTGVADAADFLQMKELVDRARSQWGEVDGVIHAAGIPGAGRLAFLKTLDDVRAVLAPKIDGLTVLTQLLGERPLDFVALMSSIDAVVGSPGASDYSAANAYLDAFQESEDRPKAWRKVITFNWGAWRDVGMAADLVVPEARRALWEDHLRNGISPEVGMDLFERGIQSNWERIVVTPYDITAPMRLADPVGLGSVSEKTVESEGPGLTGASDSELGDKTQLVVAAIWRELLGVPHVGMQDDFFQLGGHSLLATRMMARIYDSFGVRVSLRDVFDAPTVDRLSQRIDAAIGGAQPASIDDGEREEIVF